MAERSRGVASLCVLIQGPYKGILPSLAWSSPRPLTGRFLCACSRWGLQQCRERGRGQGEGSGVRQESGAGGQGGSLGPCGTISQLPVPAQCPT